MVLGASLGDSWDLLGLCLSGDWPQGQNFIFGTLSPGVSIRFLGVFYSHEPELIQKYLHHPTPPNALFPISIYLSLPSDGRSTDPIVAAPWFLQ